LSITVSVLDDAFNERPIMNLNWPLMENNITEEDLSILIDFLKTNPRLTQSSNVLDFEKKWSEWLGVRYSVFVNSGASANLITMAAMKHLYGLGEIIVPTLTWVSDIASVLQNGFDPVFVDINPRNLCMNDRQVISKLTEKTKAVFIPGPGRKKYPIDRRCLRISWGNISRKKAWCFWFNF